MATLIVLAAGAFPPCVNGWCCPDTSDAPAVHAEMPCCAEQTSIANPDVARARPATFAGFELAPQTSAPAETIDEIAPPRTHAAHSTPVATHQPSPPLFLLNAQFII